MRERERVRDHHHDGQKGISRDMMQRTKSDILRNPSLQKKKKIQGKDIFFLIQVS